MYMLYINAARKEGIFVPFVNILIELLIGFFALFFITKLLGKHNLHKSHRLILFLH